MRLTCSKHENGIFQREQRKRRTTVRNNPCGELYRPCSPVRSARKNRSASSSRVKCSNVCRHVISNGISYSLDTALAYENVRPEPPDRNR